MSWPTFPFFSLFSCVVVPCWYFLFVRLDSQEHGRLIFSVPALAPHETLMSAELHVAPWQVVHLMSQRLRSLPLLKLSVHSIIAVDADGDDSSSNSIHQTKLTNLDSEFFLTNGTDWCRLNVLVAVRRWLAEGGGRGQLKLRLHAGPNADADLGMFLGQQPRPDGLDVEPTLHISVVADHTKNGRGHGRKARDVDTVPDGKCRVYAHEIHVKDIGWDDFIISPKIINFTYCAGKCDFPLPPTSRIRLEGSAPSPTYKISRHAMFQSLFNHLYEKAAEDKKDERINVPCPSCVPVTYRNMSLLFMPFDVPDAKIKRFEDILVRDCSCA